MTGIDLRKKPLAFLSGGRSTVPLMGPLSEKYALAFLFDDGARLAASRNLGVVNMAMLMRDAKRQMDAMNVTLPMMADLSFEVDNVLDGLMEEMRAEDIRAYGAYEELKCVFLPKVFTIVGQNILRAMAWEQIARDFNVAVCVTHEDVMDKAKAFVQFWRAKGVPTLHIPHAVYICMWRGPVGEDVHDELNAEWLAVAGSHQRDWYLERGADPEKVFITGLPHWDSWAEPKDGLKARQMLHIAPDQKAVAFMSSWGQATSALGIHGLVGESYRAFLQAAKKADWQAIVKLHPGSNQEMANRHIDIAREMGVSCMVTPHYLDLVLPAVDLVVSAGASNVVIEAAMIGKPSVSTYGYADDDEVITCEPADLADVIEEGLSQDVDLNAFVDKYAYKNDGKATERIVDLIEKIVCQ